MWLVEDASLGEEDSWDLGKRREEREASRAEFLVWVATSARWRVLVSSSLRRRRRMDSGVGEEGGTGRVRFCGEVTVSGEVIDSVEIWGRMSGYIVQGIRKLRQGT